jgi:mono/diheme cytochrome c family protein
VRRAARSLPALAALLAALLHGAGTPAAPAADTAEAGKRAFAEIVRVLQSPRCQNCHPAGDRPLQTDAGVPHRMNISRRSADAGLPCGACHQERNSEALGIAGGPPGAPHWGLPPAATPMVFEGRSPRALCQQLGDPAQTGGRDLQELLAHVSDDPLVTWAWRPGGTRTKPPLTHAAFVSAFRTWVAAGGPCP